MISCFETIEFRDARFFALDAHLERLQRSASELGLGTPDRHAIGAVLDQVREGLTLSSARVRLSWNDSCRITLVTAPLRIPNHPAAVALDDIPRVLGSSLAAGLKTISYSSATAYIAAHPPADEVLMLNEHDEVCGGAHSNLFIVKDGSVTTPAPSSGCRNGVTRALLIAHLPAEGIDVEEAIVSKNDVLAADEVFICSTGRHVQGVHAINGQPVVEDHPITSLAARLFRSLHNDPTMWS